MGKIVKLFFVDTETTGLDPLIDQVIEIAASVVSIGYGNQAMIEAEYHALIRPYTHLSEFTAQHFAAETWESAVPEDVAIRRLLDMWRAHSLVDRAAWIGQNPKFDWSFLRPAARLHVIPWPESPEVDYHTFDLASMMLPIVLSGECESVSLRSSRVWAGLTGPQQHRAPGDVSDMIHVWNAIQRREAERHPINVIDEMMRLIDQNNTSGITNGFSERAAETLRAKYARRQTS